MFIGLSRNSKRRAFPHMNAGLSLPRAGLLFDIQNRYPFVDRVGKHAGPPQLLQYIQGPVDLFSDSIEGGETVTSKQGTATVTVLEGKLSVGAGTLWSFSLSNGSQYEFGSGGWAWDVSGNDRPLSVPVAACVEGREFGSNWPDTVGWSESNGEFAVGVNESEGVGEYITNGVLVPALADKSGCCAYLSDTPLASVMDSSPSAFFNGMDFRLATYTGGPTYELDHLGVLRSPGANRPAVQGMRLDGTTYLNTDESGNAILPSTPQKTVTYNTDWTAKTFAETFDKFDVSDPLKAPGWLCEPVTTNKCTCRKANPVDASNTIVASGSAVVSVVSDTFGYIDSAKLGAICNNYKLYKIDNSGFDADAIVGCIGVANNTNMHSLSCYAISPIGSAALRFNSISYGIVSSSTFSNIVVENKPASAGSQFAFYLTGRTILYFVLPQLEEGAFCTSPICKAADGSDPLTLLTRAATIASFPTAGKIPVNNFAIRMIAVPRATGQVAFLMGSYVDANNSFSISITQTAVLARKRNVSVDTEATVSLAHANGVPIDLLIVSTLTGGMQVSARVYSGSWGAFADGPLNSTVAAKANAPIASTYQLGALNRSSQFTGNISLFDCVPIPSGITDPMAWAKTHWGVA